MATAAQALTTINVALASTLGARLTSDLLTTERWTSGGRYQLKSVAVDYTARSNVTTKALFLIVTAHHQLADPDDERAYTEGDMLTNMSALLVGSYWSDLTNVLEVLEAPAASTADIVRTGDVVTFEVAVAVVVTPD